MASVKFEMKGIDEFIQKLDAAGQLLDSTLDSALDKAATEAEATLKSQGFGAYHNRTGKTASTLSHKIERHGNSVTCSVGYDMDISPAATNAVYMNYGTKRHTIHRYGNPHQPVEVKGLVAQNFVSTAEQKSADKIRESLQKSLEEALT